MCTNLKPHQPHTFKIYRWFSQYWHHCSGIAVVPSPVASERIPGLAPASRQELTGLIVAAVERGEQK